MDLEVFRTPGLGDASYLLASGGEAVLVDPQRDAWRFLEVAQRRGWRVRHVLETHVHNDYLSGALETQAATGAVIAAPARGRYEFEHRAVDEGDSVEVGGLRLTAWATPGHTPEHLAWIVSPIDSPAPVNGTDKAGVAAAFTGGSLLVGSAGRTDLLGPALTDALTNDQQRSLRRLGELPDSAQVLPTHGSGSFCAAGPGSANRVSTIAAERFANPAFRLAAGEAAPFHVEALAGLGRYPDYYRHMAAINRRGPRVLGRLFLPDALDPAAFEAKAANGATIVDARDRSAFAAAHIPGALNVELGSGFAGYVGWLVPFGDPVLLVLPDAPDVVRDATTELLRIGYERVQGWLDGGVDAWQDSGREVGSYETTTMDEAHRDRVAAPGDGRVLLDVRQPNEWSSGVVPGSRTIFVADLPAHLGELPADEPITVFCRTGHRASIAASILAKAGREVRLVSKGGAAAWPEPLDPPQLSASSAPRSG
ncbi:MAG TPA: rhodanese-like domain-containing protein [Candidatus Limnocylindrales bacterium]|nr:rhodanese-like domain-containing protein [Candidatus Limnocylindrales bacterium]